MAERNDALFCLRFGFVLAALDCAATWVATLPAPLPFSIMGWIGCGLMWLGTLPLVFAPRSREALGA